MRQRVALAGLTGGVSLLGMYYWWRHRHDGSGVGYVNGKPITLTLVTVDGKPVEVSTAAAFAQLRAAARAHGVRRHGHLGRNLGSIGRAFHCR